MEYDIRKLTDYLWELPQAGGMRLPARIYATEKLLPQILSDNAPQQAANVAHLPGIVKASLSGRSYCSSAACQTRRCQLISRAEPQVVSGEGRVAE